MATYGQWIIPTVITFGSSVAPFVFTKIMKVVLQFARLLLIHGTNCIDDNLWAECATGMDEVKAILQLVFAKLGWVFNEKCEFTPSTTVLYNGMWIDPKQFEIRATDKKIDAARRLAWTQPATVSRSTCEICNASPAGSKASEWRLSMKEWRCGDGVCTRISSWHSRSVANGMNRRDMRPSTSGRRSWRTSTFGRIGWGSRTAC
jgi:hypothetical protein